MPQFTILRQEDGTASILADNELVVYLGRRLHNLSEEEAGPLVRSLEQAEETEWTTDQNRTEIDEDF